MINLDMYQNLFVVERDEHSNSSIVKSIYDSKGKNVSNSLIDKNLEIRYIESLYGMSKFKSVIFCEGITDYFVLKNILDNDNDVFIVPLFGSDFVKTAQFHLPYLFSYTSKIKLLVDNDPMGDRIKDWFLENTTLSIEDVRTYSYFFEGKNDLEKSITDPWFDENIGFEKTSYKKLNSLIFSENNKFRDKYADLIKFIKD